MSSAADTDLPALAAERFAAVCETEEARTFLEANALKQRVVFDVRGGENVELVFEPHSADLTVRAGPADPEAEYELFLTTIVGLDADVLESLLGGDLLTTHYLEGKLDLHGIPPMWSVLGPLFRINADLLDGGTAHSSSS